MQIPAFPVTVLIADDDDGHAFLIETVLREAGLNNPILRFRDGVEVMDFLLKKDPANSCLPGHSYLLLLDIRMPKMDGVQVLAAVKQNPGLRSLPVIMLTTTDDPREMQACYDFGCNCYITKPVGFEAFTESLKRVGLFLQVVSLPQLHGPSS